MIAAYDDVIARGIGAVTFEGKMIDVPVVEREKALLRQAERFAARRAPSSTERRLVLRLEPTGRGPPAP